MVPLLPVVIHEHQGFWGRQLRPRLASAPVRVIETRSRAELRDGVRRSSCPVLLVVLDDRRAQQLADLASALEVAPKALALVIDPPGTPGLAALARELGATHVFPGPTVPPRVMELLERWIPLARRRAEMDGWWPPPRLESVVDLPDLPGRLDHASGALPS